MIINIWAFVVLFTLAGLAGCARLPVSLPGIGPTAAAEATPTAPPDFQPTLSTGGFRVVPSPACPVVTTDMLQADPQSGDLLDWEPGGSRLAYLATTSTTTWHLGDVAVLDLAEDAPEPVSAASNAAGQLHWLEDGRLVFEAFRPADSVYTVRTVRPDGSQPVDFFPGSAAHTDNFSSPKAVIDEGGGELTLFSVCGLDCLKTYRVSPDGVVQPAGQLTALDGRNAWLPEIKTREAPAEETPAMYAANWTADGMAAVYYDGQANEWVLNLDSQELFALGISELPLETDWSDDGRYLAVRGDGMLKVYDIQCEAN